MHRRTGPWPAARLRAAGMDLGVAALVLLVGLLATAPTAAGQGYPAPDAPGYLLITVAGAALVLRRHHPTIMISIVGTATALYLAVGYVWGPILLAIPVAAFAAAQALPLRRAMSTVAIVVFVIIIGVSVRAARGIESWSWIGLLALLGLILTPALAGATVRAMRRSAALLRAEHARRIAADERLRVSREVHDVVGHGLAVIAMQSGVALHLLNDDHHPARATLEAIRTTSRESLSDLRSELARFRDPDDDPSHNSEDIGPADFDLLAERLRSGGRTVNIDIADVESLPGETRRLCYQIVREALTNVVRHATTDAAVTITVRSGADGLLVEIVDTGTQLTTGESIEGHGIRGMRDRIEASGGFLTAGPRSDGGFGVRALIPAATDRS